MAVYADVLCINSLKLYLLIHQPSLLSKQMLGESSQFPISSPLFDMSSAAEEKGMG